MSPVLRVAYVLTPITFGGLEKVSLNFLSNYDRDRIDLHVIALVRPWEEPPLLLEEVTCWHMGTNRRVTFTGLPLARL